MYRYMDINKKASIVMVLKILEEYSDEDHPLTQADIIAKISELYDVEIERKSISRSIHILTELGYDINRGARGGYALYERTFDKSEITFLLDAIFSSKSITGKQAITLAKKISGCLSIYNRKQYKYLEKSNELSRTSNKQIFHNIDVISLAIEKGVGIKFKYQEYNDNDELVLRYNGYEYHTSPCFLVNNFGKYYYLGYRDKYHKVSPYRIDYMVDVHLDTEMNRIDPFTLDEFKYYASITEYLNDHIYVYDGEVKEFDITLKGAYVIQYIHDWFGNNAKIYKEDDVIKAHIRCNENAFKFWSRQYSDHIDVEDSL